MKTQPVSRHSLSDRRRGASTVEMALISPVLFLVIFGTIEIAFGYMVHHLIQDAARQGCRSAISPGATNTSVKAKINTLLQAEHISGSTIKILVNNVVADVSTAKASDQITVQITVPATKVSMFPVSGYLKGNLSALCTMRHD